MRYLIPRARWMCVYCQCILYSVFFFFLQHLKLRAEERALTEEEAEKVRDEAQTRRNLAEAEALFATLEVRSQPDKRSEGVRLRCLICIPFKTTALPTSIQSTEG